jgi:hypothetical protein
MNQIENSTESENIQKKKRGAPKGSRPVIWVCSSLINNELVSERYRSIYYKDKLKDNENDNFSKKNVVDIFVEKWNVEPQVVYGPFFDKKGGSASKVKKRASVKMNLADLRFNGVRKEAVFNGWCGVANYLENSDIAAYFIFTHEVSPRSDKKRSTPAPKIIEISALENISPAD